MAIDHEKIRHQAKKIMDEFMEALSKVKDADVPVGFEHEEFLRESKGSCDPAFPERMLKNAPKRKDRYLVAEKKHW